MYAAMLAEVYQIRRSRHCVQGSLYYVFWRGDERDYRSIVVRVEVSTENECLVHCFNRFGQLLDRLTVTTLTEIWHAFNYLVHSRIFSDTDFRKSRSRLSLGTDGSQTMGRGFVAKYKPVRRLLNLIRRETKERK